MSANYGNIPQNFLKAGTTWLFTPTGDAGAIKVPSCTMAKLNYGSGETDVLFADKDTLVLGDHAITEVKPVYELTFNQKLRPLDEILLMGTRLSDVTQAAATGSSVTFPAVYALRSYNLGAQMVTNVVVTVGAAVKVLGTDYQLDPEIGYLTIMQGGSIPESTPTTPSPVTVTFNKPALTFTQHQAFTRPNRYGQMVGFTRDAINPQARSQVTFPCNLMASDFGDRDPKKYSDFKLKLAVLGTVLDLSRQD